MNAPDPSKPFRVFGGMFNGPLYDEVVARLRQLDTTGTLFDSESTEFKAYWHPSGAPYVQTSDVRRRQVFLLDTLRLNGADIFMMMTMAQASRLASAGTIYSILPFLDARQDCKTNGREAITAPLAFDSLGVAGVRRYLVFDPHVRQVQGMAGDRSVVDCLYSPFVFMPVIRSLGLDPAKVIVMGPDVGSMKRNRPYAELIGCDLGCADKRRTSDRDPIIFNVIGDVEGKTVLLCDDILDKGGTLVGAVEAFLKRGAKNVFGFISHGVFSSPVGKPSAVELVKGSKIERLYVTDSLMLPSDLPSNVEVVSIADMLAKAIFNLHYGISLSSLILESGKRGN